MKSLISILLLLCVFDAYPQCDRDEIPRFHQVRFSIIAHPEMSPPGDNEIIDRINNCDLWAWANVEVRGSFQGITHSVFLPRVSFASESDFKESEFYTDMKHEVYKMIVLDAKREID